MKKTHYKKALCLFILSFLLLITGCRNIFIPANMPMVIFEKPKLNETSQKQIEIQSYRGVSPGNVQDISHNGNSLILLNSNTDENLYTIDLFSPETEALVPFIVSDNKEFSAQFDSKDSGIFYVEESMDSITEKLNSQLLWTDIDKNISRVISLPEENVSKVFFISEPEKVIYTNNRNEIVVSDNQGNRNVYTTAQNINIIDLAYLKSENKIIFLSEDPTKDGKTNLYSAKISNDSLELHPKLIEENILSFGVNELNEKVVFVKNSNNSQSIGIWDSKTELLSTLPSSGNFYKVQFTPSGEEILYTQWSSNSEAKTQSVWIMDADGKNPLQITSNLKMTSDIIFHPFKSILYFSVEEDSDENQLSKGQIPQLTYQINYSIN